MKKTVGLFGCGSLATIIGETLKNDPDKAYKVVSVYDHGLAKAVALANRLGCEAAATLEGFLTVPMDYVIEAAAPSALRSAGPRIVLAGHDLIVLSAGAFADAAFEKSLNAAAEVSDRKVYVASGAIGGFDALQTAALMGITKAAVINEKPPGAFVGAPVLADRTLSETVGEILFEGNAVEAIKAFPKNVNVAVAAARLGGGLADTRIVIKSVPGMKDNSHRIVAEGDFGKLDMTFVSAPSKANPGSSAMAAYSVIALLKKLNSRIEW